LGSSFHTSAGTQPKAPSPGSARRFSSGARKHRHTTQERRENYVNRRKKTVRLQADSSGKKTADVQVAFPFPSLSFAIGYSDSSRGLHRQLRRSAHFLTAYRRTHAKNPLHFQ